MKEVLIFLIIFLIVFVSAFIIFNGRFIYAQIKYSVLGSPPIYSGSEEVKQRPERLVIPSIGIDAPVILAESADEYVLQKALEEGVVNYPNSNIILGHSSAYPWYQGNYGSVFSLLNKLEVGDEVFVFSAEKKYTYQVINKEIKLPKELDIEGEKNESIIYLISCWPINTNWKRIVIKAQLIDRK